MSIRFSWITGEVMRFLPGLPDNYSGPVLKGARASYFTAGFGQIVIQEFTTGQISIHHLLMNWKKPERIICRYHYPAGVFARIVHDNPLHEYIKGAGEIHIKKEQFAALAGSSWTGMISPIKAGPHHFTDLCWSSGFVQDSVAGDTVLQDAIENTDYGLPERLSGRSHHLNSTIRSMLDDLQLLDFNASPARNECHAQMKRLFRHTLKEFRDQEWVKRGMNDTDWQRIGMARTAIDTNLDGSFSTPELSVLIGMNEYKLKKLFHQVTGFNIDEYHTYQLFMIVRRKILQQPDRPLKSFFAEAGYASFPAFIRRFRKLCSCTPGELREEGWDVRGLSNNIANMEMTDND